MLQMFRVPPPSWSPTDPLNLADDFEQADYANIVKLRDEINAEIDRAVQRYIDETGEDDSFPELHRMTGEFYLRSESYYVVWHEWFKKIGRPREVRFSFFICCLEQERSEQIADRDYLGLDVHFCWHPDTQTYEWTATDSSSI